MITGFALLALGWMSLLLRRSPVGTPVGIQVMVMGIGLLATAHPVAAAKDPAGTLAMTFLLMIVSVALTALSIALLVRRGREGRP